MQCKVADRESCRYRVERFYPLYYSKRRPEPSGLLSQLGYGGSYFNVTLSADDLSGNVSTIAKAKVVIIRPGFSTHALVCHSTLCSSIKLTP